MMFIHILVQYRYFAWKSNKPEKLFTMSKFKTFRCCRIFQADLFYCILPVLLLPLMLCCPVEEKNGIKNEDCCCVHQWKTFILNTQARKILFKCHIKEIISKALLLRLILGKS
jgi:hypothetical protein